MHVYTSDTVVCVDDGKDNNCFSAVKNAPNDTIAERDFVIWTEEGDSYVCVSWLPIEQ